MSVVIDTFIYNYNYSSLKLQIIQNDKYYDIILSTDASYYYCINDCGSSRCHCKDKDWAQGRWKGELLTYNFDKVFSENLYNFLKENSSEIIFLNRKKLSKWFDENEYKYLKKYYSDKVNTILQYLQTLQKVGIFSKEFYDLVKEDFKRNNIDILKLVIRTEYNHELNRQMIFIDDIFVLSIDYNNYDDNKITSLVELSYSKIQEIFRQNELLGNLYDEIVFNNLNDVNIDDITYKQLLKCMSIMLRYNQLSEYKTNYELYFKKGHEIDKDIYDVYDILDKLNDITEKWQSMEYNYRY
jgi:hypothetical protein